MTTYQGGAWGVSRGWGGGSVIGLLVDRDAMMQILPNHVNNEYKKNKNPIRRTEP